VGAGSSAEELFGGGVGNVDAQSLAGNLLHAEGVETAVVEQQRLLLTGVVDLMAHPHTQVWGAVDGEVLLGVVVDLDALALVDVDGLGGEGVVRSKVDLRYRLLTAGVTPRRGDVDGQRSGRVLRAGQYIAAGLGEGNVFHFLGIEHHVAQPVVGLGHQREGVVGGVGDQQGIARIEIDAGLVIAVVDDIDHLSRIAVGRPGLSRDGGRSTRRRVRCRAGAAGQHHARADERTGAPPAGDG